LISTDSRGTPGLVTTRSIPPSQAGSSSPRYIAPVGSLLRSMSVRRSVIDKIAPRLARNRAAAAPVTPSPTTITCFPPSSISTQLQRTQRDQRANDRRDPEPDHDDSFGNSFQLKMMMQRRH